MDFFSISPPGRAVQSHMQTQMCVDEMLNENSQAEMAAVSG
jgi:hypothetical protein